ncbi:MAG TPA: helix-turn-helix domain-containing protein [Acetobacteraceae bacterium]|nr:helix-turn-helix domain-containing protein [Acetobacteraceae bacterium]
MALEPSRFDGSVSRVEFGDVAVEIVHTSPALLIQRANSGRAGCLLMLEGADRAKWDGRSIDRCDVAALTAETTLVASFYDPFTSAFVSTSEDEAEAILGSWAWTKQGRGALALQRPPRPAHARFSACVREIERLVRHAPDVVRDDRSRTALRASLVEGMQSLCRPSEEAKADRTRATRRHRLVRLTDEYLCANPIRAVYTDDLCQALGVSASALHKAFQDVFGISPHRYLKLRRMSLVRAALLSPSGPWRSVKAAALSYGFWHLGQFAQDYRESYGELPSATLARSGGGAK